jgi:P-type Ca2+ transporter type 2C
MAVPVVRVRRGGPAQDLPAAEVVPGDLVLLGPGDLLPADLRLAESWLE